MKNLDLFNIDGERLKTAREAVDLTQARAAKLLNIDRRTIWSYENNTGFPSGRVLARMMLLYKIRNIRQIVVESAQNAA